MTKKVTKTGKELEQRVADAYRAMGAWRVEHDVELAGNQIDVYVELETPGHLLHHIAVEAKEWTSPVGIDVVNGFAQIVKLLHSKRLIDEGIIVSATGFSKQARNAAQAYGIRLLEPADLDAMVGEMLTPGLIPPAMSPAPVSAASSTIHLQPETVQATGVSSVGLMPSKLTERSPHSNIAGSSGVHEEFRERTGYLDTRILQLLYGYYCKHLGDPRMDLNEFAGMLGTERADVMQCLLGLREKGWLDYSLTEGAESGLVWLTQLGIRVAKNTYRN